MVKEVKKRVLQKGPQVPKGDVVAEKVNLGKGKKTTAVATTKPKVQNDLDENLVEEAVKGLLAYEAKKSIQENASNLLDQYAKPILVQVTLPALLSFTIDLFPSLRFN
jgi:hypothetical protein